MADEQAGVRRQVLIRTAYLKDLSFVSPKAPDIFAVRDTAERLLNVRSRNAAIDEKHVEVELTVTVKAVAAGESVFQIETVQAGIFLIEGYGPDERVEILGRVCPEMLFPFARAVIDSVTRRTGFRSTLLIPLDFHSLFAENMRERGSQSAGP